MTHYAKGSRLEHAAKRILEAEGYEVVRSSGSHSAVDLVAWNAGDLRLVQVKSGGRLKKNVTEIRSRVKAELARVPVIEGGSRELWVRFGGAWLRWCLVDNGEAWKEIAT